MLDRWHNDARFMRFLGAPSLTRDQSKAALDRYRAHWREHGFGIVAAEWRETGELVGRTGVGYHRAWPHDPELGWALDPAWWGRGIATEMGGACVRWGFDALELPRLVSICVEENVASRRVMEKLGFRLHEKVPDPVLGIELWVHALDAR